MPWNPFKAIVAPRPIGWISTVSTAGVVNLAPYSYFQAVNDGPDIVMFSASPWMYAKDGTVATDDGVRKHSELNARETGEFVCSLATWDLRHEMNATSANPSHDIGEPELAGIEMAASLRVTPPRVAASPAALECVYLDIWTEIAPIRTCQVALRVDTKHLQTDRNGHGWFRTSDLSRVKRGPNAEGGSMRWDTTEVVSAAVSMELGRRSSPSQVGCCGVTAARRR